MGSLLGSELILQLQRGEFRRILVLREEGVRKVMVAARNKVTGMSGLELDAEIILLVELWSVLLAWGKVLGLG